MNCIPLPPYYFNYPKEENKDKFKVAVFYDIENLICGYSEKTIIQNLSLKSVFKKITNKIKDKIAIQRAYANWSDPRLNGLKNDIVELGIAPIQMFGFGKGSQKNASDIQLTIDVVETLLKNDFIETFVIVSGDGGFSSLAKKLHEYGKNVIGCAYKKSTNKVFQYVSDDFIWLEEPEEYEEYYLSKVTSNGNILNNDPIVNDFIKL